ncbi:MAG: diacylglycerol kinase family protein [Azospirillaceae bacterium]
MASRLVVVVNRSGGTAKRLGRTALTTAIERGLDGAGRTDATVAMVSGGEIAERIDSLIAGAEEVWVGGGDGTVRTVAARLLDTGIPLGIIPLGTMNLLAHDLGLPQEIDAAMAALTTATAEAMDVGVVSHAADPEGAIFLIKSALGLYPEMVVDRERRRRLFGHGKWPAMVRASLRALRRNRTLEVDLVHDGERRRLTTPAIVVSNNPYEFRAGRLFTKPDLASGELTVYVSTTRGRAGLALQLVKIFTGGLPRDRDLEIIHTSEIEIAFRRSRPVANDGEVAVVRAPVRYSLRPRALTVLRPPDAENGST